MQKLLIAGPGHSEKDSERENPQQSMSQWQHSRHREERTGPQHETTDNPPGARSQQQRRNIVPDIFTQNNLYGEESPCYRRLIDRRDGSGNATGNLPRE